MSPSPRLVPFSWQSSRRRDGGSLGTDAPSFANQPVLVKIATALAVSNSLLFFAY
jgi:hypothetical protein